MAATDQITDIVNACNPRIALPADDPKGYYVDCWEVRGGLGLRMVERLVRGSDSPTHQLISGHTGCGKTTEIYRLQAELEKKKNGKKYKVVYLDADKLLDLSNVDFVDILLALGAQLESLEKEFKVTSLTAWKRMMDEIRNLLDHSEFTFNLGVMSVKSGGTQRSELRKSFGNYLAQLIKRINEVLGKVREKVHQEGYAGLVMIVDNLEKIIPVNLDDFGKTNHEAIYVDRASLFTDLDVHLLLTVPLALCHLCDSAGKLGGLYDGELAVIPMIKVLYWENNREFDKGLEYLEKILSQRIVLEKVFDRRESWLEACRMSGGAIRDLLRIIRGASLYCDQAPITEKEVRKAVQEIVNSFNRVVGPYVNLFKQVHQTKQFPNDTETRIRKIALQELFVLEYSNGDQWYDIHPFIRRTRIFRESK